MAGSVDQEAVAVRGPRRRVRTFASGVLLVASFVMGFWWMVQDPPLQGGVPAALAIAAPAVVGFAMSDRPRRDPGWGAAPSPLDAEPGLPRRPAVAVLRRPADVRVYLTDEIPDDPRDAVRGQPDFSVGAGYTALPEVTGAVAVDVTQAEGSTHVTLLAPGGGPVIRSGRRGPALPLSVAPKELGLFEVRGLDASADPAPVDAVSVVHVAGPGVEVRTRRDALLVVVPNVVVLMVAIALGAALAAAGEAMPNRV